MKVSISLEQLMVYNIGLSYGQVAIALTNLKIQFLLLDHTLQNTNM